MTKTWSLKQNQIVGGNCEEGKWPGWSEREGCQHLYNRILAMI